MLTTVHLLIGAVIGKYVNNAWVIIIISILSHYVLDFIPHYSHQGFEKFRELGFAGIDKRLILIGIEPILGLILVIFLIYMNKERVFPMVLGSFFAWFPDLLTFISWKYLSYKYNINIFEKILPRPGNFLYNACNTLFGIFIQIVIAIVAIIALIFDFRFPR